MSSVELINACAASTDGAAWEEFVSRFHRPISLAVLRTASQWGNPSRQAVDDLVQETYLKLCSDKCRSLRQFAMMHPDAVPGYIKTTAVNVVHDSFKSLHARKRGSGEILESLDKAEQKTQRGEGNAEAAIEHTILLKQIDSCLEICSEGPDQDRDREIFWLYYQQGMSAKAIAALPTVGLSPKGVESAIHRLTRAIRDQIVLGRSEESVKPNPTEKGFRSAESY